MSWLKEPILVTGATGFIGGRVCERLVQDGAPNVRALVHDPRHAARIARLRVRLCHGDLLDGRSLRAALGDARIIVHLGLGFGPAIPRGTRNLLAVARQAGVQRFIHISTTGVYGLRPPPGSDTEDARPRRTGNVYCDSKLRAERAVARQARRGLPAVILRPGIVYGPCSRWCTSVIQRLNRGQGVLIDGGSGICSTTYVDNLVDAIFLAIEKSDATGRIFSITDGESITWGEFIRAHAAMLHPSPPLLNISSAEIRAYYRAQPGLWRGSWRQARQLIVSREFRDTLKRIPLFERGLQRMWYWLQNLSEEQKELLRARLTGSARNGHHGTPVPDPETWALQTGSVVFRIDRAKNVLGYRPRVSFARGMRLTEDWLRWASYL